LIQTRSARLCCGIAFPRTESLVFLHLKNRRLTEMKMSRQILFSIVFVFLLAAISAPNALAFQASTKGADKKSSKKDKSPSASKADAAATDQDKDKDKDKEDPALKGLTWRLVGPFRGGRVLAVGGVVNDPFTY